MRPPRPRSSAASATSLERPERRWGRALPPVRNVLSAAEMLHTKKQKIHKQQQQINQIKHVKINQNKTKPRPTHPENKKTASTAQKITLDRLGRTVPGARPRPETFPGLRPPVVRAGSIPSGLMAGVAGQETGPRRFRARCRGAFRTRLRPRFVPGEPACPSDSRSSADGATAGERLTAGGVFCARESAVWPS